MLRPAAILGDKNKFQQYTIHDVICVYFKVSYTTCCGQPPSWGILLLLFCGHRKTERVALRSAPRRYEWVRLIIHFIPTVL